MSGSAEDALTGLNASIYVQYHIPVLHLHSNAVTETAQNAADDFDSLAGRNEGVLKGGRVMKHRIDKEELIRRIQGWTEKLNAQL